MIALTLQQGRPREGRQPGQGLPESVLKLPEAALLMSRPKWGRGAFIHSSNIQVLSNSWDLWDQDEEGRENWSLPSWSSQSKMGTDLGSSATEAIGSVLRAEKGVMCVLEESGRAAQRKSSRCWTKKSWVFRKFLGILSGGD